MHQMLACTQTCNQGIQHYQHTCIKASVTSRSRLCDDPCSANATLPAYRPDGGKWQRCPWAGAACTRDQEPGSNCQGGLLPTLLQSFYHIACLLTCLEGVLGRNIAAVTFAATHSMITPNCSPNQRRQHAYCAGHLLLPSACAAAVVECMWAAMPSPQRYSPDTPVRPRASRSIEGPLKGQGHTAKPKTAWHHTAWQSTASSGNLSTTHWHPTPACWCDLAGGVCANCLLPLPAGCVCCRSLASPEQERCCRPR